MTQYLYGGRVQSIQSYLFHTDKLKEIIGASELVNEIASEQFVNDFFKQEKPDPDRFSFIQAAAGNLKIIFKSEESEEDVKRMVKEFPKLLCRTAPGISYSQAVIKTNKDSHELIGDLEKKLAEQKNRPDALYYPALAGLKRSNRTALPVTNSIYNPDNKKEMVDEATNKKHEKTKKAHFVLAAKLLNDDSQSLSDEKLKKARQKFPLVVDDIANKKSYIAVVHIDGNGLGQIIQDMSVNMKKDNIDIEKLEKKWKKFSDKLDQCTVEAAKEAFEDTIVKKYKNDDVVPFRPLVLGGDDFTFICRADDALSITKRFLEIFEKKTSSQKDAFSGRTITACAGIAYVKKNYPAHFSSELAEELCGRAKKAAKKINKYHVPSCLMFMREESSFHETLKEKIKRTRQTGNVEFMFGPYATSCDKLPQIDHLEAVAETLENTNPFRTFLRKWVSAVYNNREEAQLLRNRFDDIAQSKYTNYNTFKNAMKDLVALGKEIKEELWISAFKEEKELSPAADLLTLMAIRGEEQSEDSENNKEGSDA